jgi:hypothetical protein
MAISPDDQRRIDAAAARAGVDAATLAAVVAEGATLTAAQRDRVRKERGLDARESRDNELDAMAIELARAQKAAPSPELAVAAFKADSADPASWDRPTRAFARRVSRRTGAGIQMQAPAPAPAAPAPAAPVEATPAPMAVAPPAGEAEPQGRQFGRAPEPEPVADEADPKWVDAYRSGQMSPQDRAEFEADVQAGRLRLPEGVTLQAPTAPAPSGGILDSLADVVTGDSRKTAQTEASLDVNLSPQFNEMRMAALQGGGPTSVNQNLPLADQVKQGIIGGIKQGVGGALQVVTGGLTSGAALAGFESAPQREQMQMVAAANPQLQVVRDEKGNQSFVDATGARYGETPGLGLTDIPRIAATVGPGLVPGAGGLTGARAIGAAMGLQGAQEAAQTVMGGEFNVEDVALAGAGEALPMLRAAKPASEAATEGTEAVAKPMAADALGDTFRKAAGGNAEAQAQIATMARVDKEAAKAAADLGLDVPVDILADGPQVREAMDAVRSKLAGPERAAVSEAEAAFIKKADEALASFDAAFVDGRVAPGEVSGKVAASLKAARDEAKQKAADLYQQVDDVLKPAEVADLANVRATLNKRFADVGGNMDRLAPAERRLMQIATDPATTYQTLRDEKAAIQAAIRSDMAQTPYAGVDRVRLQALESALKNDQLAVAAKVGGEEARRALVQANRYTAMQKGLEERAVSAFGKTLEGDLSPLMRRAMTQAMSDDNKAFRQLMKVVPPEHKREVLATALANLTRGRAGGGFSSAEFVKVYPALYKNKLLREEIKATLGPEADKMLAATYALAKRFAAASKRTPKTGESLQVLERLDAPQGLVGRVLGNSVGRGAAVAVASQIPVVGGLMAGALSAVPTKAKGQTLEAVAALFRDDAFAKLAIDMANGTVPPADIKRMARNPRFRAFLKALKEPHDPTSAERWLTSGTRGASLGRSDREPVEKRPTL